MAISCDCLLSSISLHTVKYCLSNLVYLQGSADHVLATILTARNKCYALPSTAPSSTSCLLSPLRHLHTGRPATSANLHTSESLQFCLSPPWSCSVITWLLTACPTCLACQSRKIHGHYPVTKGQISSHAVPHMLHLILMVRTVTYLLYSAKAWTLKVRQCHIHHKIITATSWSIIAVKLQHKTVPACKPSIYSKMKKSLVCCEDLQVSSAILLSCQVEYEISVAEFYLRQARHLLDL